VKAEEIRTEVRDALRQFNVSRPSNEMFWILTYAMLGELTAQLAEVNDNLERNLEPVLTDIAAQVALLKEAE